MRFRQNILAVTFDVGNTLIEPWPSVGHVYARVAARHGHANLDPDDLTRRFRGAFQAHEKEVSTRQEWAEIVDETFAGLLPQSASKEFFPALYDCFADGGAWRIYDDADPALAALRQRGLKLGVISNWDDRLRPLLKSLQITDWFDSIVVSCEVGASKPASAIFEAAVEKLGLPARSILHVGDSFEMDVLGARATGLHAVQIERQAKSVRDGQIKSLLDLLALV